MSKKDSQNVPRGLTLLEALNQPAASDTPLEDKQKVSGKKESVVKRISKSEGRVVPFPTGEENSARSIIADPQTERSIYDALRIEDREFSKLVHVAQEIVAMTAPIEREINKTRTETEPESDFPTFGIGAVVLFNVIHSIGVLAQRLDDFRQKLYDLDRSSKSKGFSISGDFEKKFAVYLACRMNVDLDLLSTLPESDLHICQF